MSKAKSCACCGQYTKGKQWWNRDTGFGVCEKCFIQSVERDGPAYSVSCYGHPGIHHSLAPVPEQTRKSMGKEFKVRLITPSQAVANLFCHLNQDCSVFDASNPSAIVICENAEIKTQGE
jgi:hypothetical protein